MSEQVVITGVAGFIGSNLAKRLIDDGYRVRGVDNLAYGLVENIPPGVDFIKKDIRDKDLMKTFKGADYIFHLAAKNCISDCQQDPVETAEINVFGTVNVFEAAKGAGVRKLIYAESSALYEGSKVLPTRKAKSSRKASTPSARRRECTSRTHTADSPPSISSPFATSAFTVRFRTIDEPYRRS